jgi:hypothetical protein
MLNLPLTGGQEVWMIVLERSGTALEIRLLFDHDGDLASWSCVPGRL